MAGEGCCALLVTPDFGCHVLGPSDQVPEGSHKDAGHVSSVAIQLEIGSDSISVEGPDLAVLTANVEVSSAPLDLSTVNHPLPPRVLIFILSLS